MKTSSFNVSVAVFLICMFALAVTSESANAADVVYIHIKSDGSVDPVSSPIQRSGDFYVFTGNISMPSTYNVGILIERSNIILDGAGHTLQAPWKMGINGIKVSSGNNVTIRNAAFNNVSDYAIRLESSEGCIVNKNSVNHSMFGIALLDYSSHNYVSENLINNSGFAIYVGDAWSNTITGNQVESNGNGICIEGSSSTNNSIVGNNIIENNDGISLRLGTSNNHIYHNNIINNAVQFDVSTDSGANFWDNGTYGGNYWSDYQLRYPAAGETDSSGIWNTPYVIDSENQDRYPLVVVIPEFPSMLVLMLSMAATFIITALCKPKNKCLR